MLFGFTAIGQNPRVVQLMSPPYSGNVALNAGPAQFGLDLTKGDVGVTMYLYNDWQYLHTVIGREP